MVILNYPYESIDVSIENKILSYPVVFIIMIPFSLLLSELIMRITQKEHHKIFIRENFL